VNSQIQGRVIFLIILLVGIFYMIPFLILDFLVDLIQVQEPGIFNLTLETNALKAIFLKWIKLIFVVFFFWGYVKFFQNQMMWLSFQVQLSLLLSN